MIIGLTIFRRAAMVMVVVARAHAAADRANVRERVYLLLVLDGTEITHD